MNVTLGLPFFRSSPDHGTAYDIAGSGRARPDSFLAALDMAARLDGIAGVKWCSNARGMAARAAEPSSAQTLANAYRVVRMMGEGAMGGIYEARQLRLDKRVAIKVLARELAVNGEALLRFHREAEITSHARPPAHRRGVRLRARTEDGKPFLVMEYLEGEDLANG